MAACPNCGRQTLRTKDWACQWCGYPLISRAFKKIDKTFKELQEERSLALRSVEAETEPELEPEPEPAPEPRPRPVFRHVPSPEPRPEPEPERKPGPPIRPVARPEPEPEMKSLPEPVTTPEQKPMVIPPAAPIILPESMPPEPKPEIKIEPEPPPEPPIKLEAISDGMEISADQLDALYRADKSGANAKFSGKTLVVKGRVEKVFVREHLEIRYIVLTGTGKRMMWSLRCTFNKEDSSKVSRLNEGDAVTVVGKYDGYSKNIMFKDCVLV
jgi:hypothetical protein